MLQLGGIWGNDPDLGHHPVGEADDSVKRLPLDGVLGAYGGRIRIECDPSAKVTEFGPLPTLAHLGRWTLRSV